jgi:hypothetical protein
MVHLDYARDFQKSRAFSCQPIRGQSAALCTLRLVISRFQLTLDAKCLGERIPEVSKEQNLNFLPESLYAESTGIGGDRV